MWQHILLILMVILTTSCTSREVGTVTSPIGNTEITNSSLDVHFPQLINTPNAYMEALLIGELILENGCLRVKDVNQESVLLIWDSRFSTDKEGEVIRVVHSNTGEVLATVGNFVSVGGGFIDNPTAFGLKEPLPEDCLGPYYLVGESIKKVNPP
jgi:hypothetical protein